MDEKFTTKLNDIRVDIKKMIALMNKMSFSSYVSLPIDYKSVDNLLVAINEQKL